MLFEVFVYLLEFCSLFFQLTFDVSRAEYILKIYPVFLHDQPIINNQHGIIDSLLYFFGLRSLSLQVPIPKNSTEVGQKVIQLKIKIINLVNNKGILIPRIISLVFLRSKL